MPTLIAVLLVFAACFSSAQDPSLTEKFRKTADYKVIRADFLQIRHLAELGMDVEIRGEMVCEKNGRLRWQVNSPIKSITVIKQNELRHLDWETGKLAVIDSGKFPWLGVLRDCMTDWITADPDRLKQRFELVLKDGMTLRLLPKVDQVRQIFTAVEIRLSADSSAIEQILIEEKTGDRLTIRFSRVRKNPVLPERIWQLPTP